MVAGSFPAGDDLIAARLTAGDDSALREVYAAYSSVVWGLARRVTGSVQLADDVTQEVFVTVWEHPDRFDGARGSLRTFLCVLAHRRAVDEVRRSQARRAREERHASRDVTAEASIPETVVDGLTADRVRAAVSTLPEGQRRAVELAYFEGCTFCQVAEVLGIPEGTAKSRLRLGLQKLAGALERELATS